MTTSQKRPVFFWVLVLYAVILTVAFIAVGTLVYRSAGMSRQLGWEFEFLKNAWHVTEVDPHGPARGKLQPGDRIQSINGGTSFDTISINAPRTIWIPTDSYTIRIQRGVATHEYRLDILRRKDLHALSTLIKLFLAALISGIAALVIGFSRPDHRTIQLFAFTTLSLALGQLISMLKEMEFLFGPQILRLGHWIWLASLSPFSVATGYDSFSRFTSGRKEPQPWSILRKIFYVWAGALVVFFTFCRLRVVINPQDGVQFLLDYRWLTVFVLKLVDMLMLIALPAICGVVAYNYRKIKQPDQRRRIQWVVYGSIVGVFPFTLFFLGRILLAMKFPFAPSQKMLDTLLPVANLFLVLVPITVGYAILKHRMFDIQIVIRRGVQYLFAKRVLQILIYLPLAIIAYAVSVNRNRSIYNVIVSNSYYLLVFIAAIAGLLFRKNLLQLLDRKFFRESYNSEQILLTLVDQIRNFNSISEVAGWVSLQLDSALHPKRLLVFYRQREKSGLALGYSSGEHRQDLQIAEDSPLIRIAEAENRSMDFISSGRQILPREDQEWLEQQKIHLMVPILGSDQRLRGLLLLGEKRSEQPYSAADRKLLEALAGQIGILHENLVLKEKVDEGARVQRDVLAHLVEQNRNLVKECPVCGTCFDSSAEKCEQDQSNLILTLPVERTIDSKYRLEKLIGRGGMGAVYQATDIRLNREVAVKIMVGSTFGDRQAIKRFEREARASAGINHPNVITIHDFGGIGEGAYLVMELLRGYSLREAIKQSGPIPAETTAEWFHQILEGMKTAHQLGIIHRDLKPENILITQNEANRSQAKILDFGLAKMKLVDVARSRSLTTPGTILGTLHYMSPEQITGMEVDERTDIFALGVMVMETLTGQQPFSGKTATEVAMAIIQKQVRLEGTSAELQRLDGILQKCIAKNQDSRFASIGEMQNDLIDAIRNCPPFSSPAEKQVAGDSTPTDQIIL